MTADITPGQLQEACQQCGFDSDLYDRADTVSSQRVIPAVLAAAIEGLDDEALAARPDRRTWSIAEYVDHVREVAFGNRFAIEAAIADPGIYLGDPPDTGIGDQKQIDVAVAIEGVRQEFGQLHTLLTDLADEHWSATVSLSGEDRNVAWFARHVLHDSLHHLGDIGRIRHGFGHGAKTATGVVSGLHVSDGGVPKRPVDSVVLGPGGVEGDRQADRRHHGRPVQALCLWSADVISELQAAGHPIAAGAAGENITIADVTWAELRPGARLDVGSVPLLISSYAIPCSKNAQWFTDGDFNRILHDRHPGFSRLYAIPLGSGSVSRGASVVVEPE